MKRVAAKFVLRLFTGDQKQSHLSVCREQEEQSEVDLDIFMKVITGDENCCHGYNPEMKQQSSQWKHLMSPRPQKERQVKSNAKTILVCFINVKGIVRIEFLPLGQTVKQTFYLAVLKCL
ncbi:uncharacterized protein LOC118764914 [Octopus sinensis]|uniref:Uncharacterized protein LOC118764914 n=1 Tax=Octopus sinensis TaxID=2607531 RepID=A0A7E6F2K2_9MOLL|nr:uncharacterized protein LOC118764914 [Octopus sinensis]